MILELIDVKKEYKLDNGNNFKALKGINVSFARGELISIIGESGSGKSTLMNLIGGLDSNFSGIINVDGKNISEFSEKELDRYRKDKIGFVFQSFNLISHLSILDNVTIAMTLSNVKKVDRVLMAKQILKEVGLENHIDKKPNQLSGGQKQRVAIARALINNPDIILADEPTGSLDSETTKQILDIIKNIASKGKLVIMVTHSEKVAQVSSRVIKIADGIIIEETINNEIEVVNEYINSVHNEKQNLSFLSAVKLALNNMKEKTIRNILVSLGASIGILSVIIMLSIGNGVQAYITDTMNGFVNPLVVEVNKKIDNNETKDKIELSAIPEGIMTEPSDPFEEADIEKISTIKNVASVEKGITFQLGNTTKIKYKEENINIKIFSTLSLNITSENILRGSYPKENEILISEEVEKELNENMIGSTVNLQFLLDNKVINTDVIVSGIYGSSTTSVMQDITQVYINYNNVENLAIENEITFKPNKIYLTSNNDKYIEGIKEEVVNLGYEGSRQEQMIQMFTEMLNVITYILSAIAGISLVVSAIMILVVLYISVVERTKEIGVLKAIGARRKDIKRIFVAESFLIGLASGLMGAIGAQILMVVINSLTNNLFGISLVIMTPSYVLFGVIISIIISMLSGIFPASKAAKLDPIESLRRE